MRDPLPVAARARDARRPPNNSRRPPPKEVWRRNKGARARFGKLDAPLAPTVPENCFRCPRCRRGYPRDGCPRWNRRLSRVGAATRSSPTLLGRKLPLPVRFCFLARPRAKAERPSSGWSRLVAASCATDGMGREVPSWVIALRASCPAATCISVTTPRKPSRTRRASGSNKAPKLPVSEVVMLQAWNAAAGDRWTSELSSRFGSTVECTGLLLFFIKRTFVWSRGTRACSEWAPPGSEGLQAIATGEPKGYWTAGGAAPRSARECRVSNGGAKALCWSERHQCARSGGGASPWRREKGAIVWCGGF